MNATNILCLKNTWLDTHENKAHCMAKERPVKGDEYGLEEDGKQVFWIKKAYRSVLPLLHETYWKSVHKNIHYSCDKCEIQKFSILVINVTNHLMVQVTCRGM